MAANDDVLNPPTDAPSSDLLAPGAKLEHLATGCIWSEGPVWLPELQAVRWSDIQTNRIMQYDSVSGATSVYSADPQFTNGRTLDLDGAVVQCSHGRRRVERDRDGEVTAVVDHFGEHRLNSPNDVVVAADGSIWFTDPPYGIMIESEGHPGEREYGDCYVFRYDEAADDLRAVVIDMDRPNGLAFSPDESVLYVADTYGDDPLRSAASASAPSSGQHIRAYDVVDGRCKNGRTVITMTDGASDGFRVDEQGRIWTSAGHGVQVYAPDFSLLLTIPVPELVANVCFGGSDGSDLYVTASSSLYRIATTTRAAARPAR